jgi:hypothetical protein
MISFCDIPLSLAKEQISKYGGYAIGMSKEWGITNRLNPVLYVEKNSIIANDLNNSRKEFKSIAVSITEIVKNGKFVPKGLLPVVKNVTNAVDNYRNTLRFIKNYRGDLVRGKRKYPNYRFYDEREWRYIPDISDNRIKPSIQEKDYIEYRGKTRSKPLLKEINIDFRAPDIKYLIVKSKKIYLN